MSFSAPTNVTVSAPSFALSPDGQTVSVQCGIPGDDRDIVGAIDGRRSSAPAGRNRRRALSILVAGRPLDRLCCRWQAEEDPCHWWRVEIISEVSTDYRGGSWGAGGTVLFGGGRHPIMSVSSSGGKAQPLTAIDVSRQEATHRFPALLPSGRFLYLIMGENPDRNGVYAGSLDGRTKKFLFPLNASAVYAPPGYPVLCRAETPCWRRDSTQSGSNSKASDSPSPNALAAAPVS